MEMWQKMERLIMYQNGHCSRGGRKHEIRYDAPTKQRTSSKGGLLLTGIPSMRGLGRRSSSDVKSLSNCLNWSMNSSTVR